MSGRASAGRRAPAPPRRPWPWMLVAISVALVIGGAYWSWSAAAARGDPHPYRVGGVGDCKQQPQFATAMGYTGHALLSSRERTAMGIVLYEPDAQGNPTRTFHDPSWTQAGFLSPPVIDRDGNVYVAPIPNINVWDNPPAHANTVYRIDTRTGTMAPLLDVPAAGPPSPDNAFGILGMTYDCDTQSVYVSSIAGSSRNHAIGRISRIDLATGQVAARLDNVDAFGLVVYNTAHGKRLVYGLARDAVVRSIALDARGDFMDPTTVRDEFSLAHLGVTGDERARRLQIDGSGLLVARLTAWTGTLVAPTEIRQTGVRYHYNATTDRWDMVDSFAIS